jgi:hypothetical protein
MSDEVAWRIWSEGQDRCEEAIARGEPVEVIPTAYGQNDFILDFLERSGLWSILTGMQAHGLRRANGKKPETLNGVEVIRELAGIDRIQHCGKVLRDTRLMLRAGFNAEQVQAAERDQRAVIDPETLGNHLARISPRSSQATFTEHVHWLRSRRWIRGGVYAADAHEITIPYGRRHERLGQVGVKFGFKLLLVINVSEERERIVGYTLAPLQTSEKTMLAGILRRLDRDVGRLDRWMKILVLDRAYWGAEYLNTLHRRFGIHVVTRAQHDELEAVQWIEKALEDARWVEREETRSRLGRIRIRLASVPGVPLFDDRGRCHGALNAVVADEYTLEGERLRDEKGDVRPRFYYVTTLPCEPRPYAIRRLYLRRWVVENQGFRELTQRWKIDTLTSRSFAANQARLAFVFMLYNAERILRMKYPGPWQQERRRLSNLGEAGLLGGPAFAAYTPQGDLGLLSAERYRDLVRIAERRRIAALLRDCIREGRDPSSLLAELDS